MSLVNQLKVQPNRTPNMVLLGIGSHLGFGGNQQTSLKPKQYLRSNNGEYSLVISDSGNVTLNRIADSSPQWSIQGNRLMRAAELRLGNDASLAIIDSKTNQHCWTSGPNEFSGHFSALTANLSDQGSLDIVDAAKQIVWSSAGQHRIVKPKPNAPVHAKPTDAILTAALSQAQGIGTLLMGDDDMGKLNPVGGGLPSDVMVYIRNNNDPMLATLYIDGEASRRIEVRLEKETHSRFRVFMA